MVLEAVAIESRIGEAAQRDFVEHPAFGGNNVGHRRNLERYAHVAKCIYDALVDDLGAER